MRRTLALLLWALVAVTLVACGSPAEPTPVPTPTPTPQEISAAIGRATQASQSAHFQIELSGKPVAVPAVVPAVLNAIEGDLQRPDAVLAVLNVTVGGGVTEIRTISLAGQQYVTSPLTLQWSCLGHGATFDPAVLFAPDKGIEFLLQDGFQDVTLVGFEEVGGRPNYHLRGTLAGAQLQVISLNLLGAGPVAVDLWADVETMRATRIVLVDTATDPAAPSTWTVNFGDYDKAVEVRAPVQCT